MLKAVVHSGNLNPAKARFRLVKIQVKLTLNLD